MKISYERLIQLEGMMKDVHALVCDKLKITPVKINIVSGVHQNLYGYASSGMLNEITIVEENITTEDEHAGGYYKLVETIIHETRHVWQFIRTDIDWKWDEYVLPEVDRDAYYNHMTEKDARRFAEIFMSRFNKEIEVFVRKCKNNEYDIPVPKTQELSEMELLFDIDLRNEPMWG